ncbi:hypothetical protein ACX3T3_03895 [Actinotignum schaalii]|uniref:hypothetical protein n=1 Tax=Actinotignum TaxID=1653174 RepID=UPI00237E7728|nr:hypothetical protein [Actinotignum sanguinis]MDE1552243.1 hypothetical protein [Actinotignum sanguinis]
MNKNLAERYPELAKFDEISKEYNACLAFIDWVTGEYEDPEEWIWNPEPAVAKFHDIDPRALERDRQKLLDDTINGDA